MTSIRQFSKLMRNQTPVSRDTRFASAWRDAAGRSNGLSGPSERLIETVAQSAASHRRVI